MHPFRRPILVSRGEHFVDGKLASLCERFGARLLPKVRVADVLPVSREALTGADFNYALKAHFDFVIADANNEALLAVEFDGPLHYSDQKTIMRDERKNRLCRNYLLPLVRAGAPSLRKADHRTLLEWIVEVWFEHHRLVEEREAMDDADWDGELPTVDPDDFDYRTPIHDSGLLTVAPLDAFADARRQLSSWTWSRLGCPTMDGWFGRHARGHHVGVLALEVEDDLWLASRGTADLRGLNAWVSGVNPAIVSQDIALLGLARQLDQWQRGRIVATSREGLKGSNCRPPKLLPDYPLRPYKD